MLKSLLGKKQSSKERGKAARAKGHAFESKVATLFRRMGYSNVSLNNRMKDSNGNQSEIDIKGRRWFRYYYIECKCYSTKSVPLEDVAKFKEVLRLNNIAASRGIFITNSTYSPRATGIGIRTIDGTQLKALISQVQLRALAPIYIPQLPPPLASTTAAGPAHIIIPQLQPHILDRP